MEEGMNGGASISFDDVDKNEISDQTIYQIKAGDGGSSDLFQNDVAADYGIQKEIRVLKLKFAADNGPSCPDNELRGVIQEFGYKLDG